MILPLAQQWVENNQENRKQSAFDAARAGKFMCLRHAKLNSLNLYTSKGVRGDVSICKLWSLSQYPLTFAIEQHGTCLYFE